MRKLGFRARNTMNVAQKLYEGVAIGEGTVSPPHAYRFGRTRREAIDDIPFSSANATADSVPEKPNVYKTTARNAQRVHEGIRPTSIRRTPDDLRPYSATSSSSSTLIWKRTVASQMEPAVYDCSP